MRPDDWVILLHSGMVAEFFLLISIETVRQGIFIIIQA